MVAVNAIYINDNIPYRNQSYDTSNYTIYTIIPVNFDLMNCGNAKAPL